MIRIPFENPRPKYLQRLDPGGTSRISGGPFRQQLQGPHVEAEQPVTALHTRDLRGVPPGALQLLGYFRHHLDLSKY